MRKQIGIAALIATAGMSATALGQDSVSSNLGNLPGDALDPWGTNSAAYVVDLAPLVTSGGHTFGVAPIMKTTRPDAAFFNNLGSSSGISTDTIMNVPFSQATYSVWDTAGAGIHATNNTPGTMISPNGNSSQFSVGYTEFATSVSENQYNSISGAIVNFDPANPNRLFVSRSTVAISAESDQTISSSSLGGVSMDAHGNVYYRGDGNGITGPNPLTGNNIYRTRLSDRTGVVNYISDAGGLDATDLLVVNHSSIHVVPNNIPASVAGGNGLYAGVNFDGDFNSGASLGTITSTAGHLNTEDGRPGTARGSNGGASVDILGLGAAHTFGIYAKDSGPDGGETRSLNLFGVDAAGLVLGSKAWDIPAAITDNDDGFVLNFIGTQEFENYRGVVAFSGGVGHVAIGTDVNGLGLFAATASEFGFEGDPFTQLIVGRYDAKTDTTEFTLAAYINVFGIGDPELGLGKAIFDAKGTEIGQLVSLDAVTGGGQLPQGPSISAPTIDAAGNIWFMAAVELFDRFKGNSDFDGALIRAVLDPTDFSYHLELVLENGSRMTGPNSGLEYRIGFLQTAFRDNGGADHASPSSVWANSASGASWNNVDISATAPGDTLANGGVVITTSITYDIDGDGRFNNPTSGNFDDKLPADEAYSVALYIGYYQDEVLCPADIDGNGQLNFFDVGDFLTNFAAGVDYNGDGSVNFFDVGDFLNDFATGCP